MVRSVDISEDVTWISECHDVGDAHAHISRYLVNAGDSYVLIDAGTGDESGFLQVLEEETDGKGVDMVLLTHSILPHTKHLGGIQYRWDDVEVVSSAPVPAQVGLEGARPKIYDTTELVAGRPFTFLDPLLTDIIVSTWILDEPSGVLFTAEGFGNYHAPGECALTSMGLADGFSYEGVRDFYADKLPYLEYVDAAKLAHGFEAVFDAYDVEVVAPIHGNPITKESLDQYLSLVLEAVRAFEPV